MSSAPRKLRTRIFSPAAPSYSWVVQLWSRASATAFCARSLIPVVETSSPEQRKTFSKIGALYEEVGWVTVHQVEKGAAVASFDFSCDTAVSGDIVVPFKEKPPVAFRAVDAPLRAFREPAAVRGHILASKDFVELLGNGQIVYTDFGSAKGAKAGDYLLILRGYAPADLNRIDRASERLPKGAETEPAAVNPAHVKQ